MESKVLFVSVVWEMVASNIRRSEFPTPVSDFGKWQLALFFEKTSRGMVGRSIPSVSV